MKKIVSGNFILSVDWVHLRCESGFGVSRWSITNAIFERNMHITFSIITLDSPCVHTVSHTVRKIKESYKRMLKDELITNLKWAYYRVDIRIERYFLQTRCGTIYCWKNDIPSNVLNQKSNGTVSIKNFLSPSTLLLCKNTIC